MKDWKKKVEKHLEQERLAKKNAEDECQREVEQKKAERIRKLNEKKMAHLATFSCHVCGIVSTKPKTTYYRDHGDDFDTGTTTEHWETPGDLWKCSICDQWVCEEHFYQGYCQLCAEKL